MTYRKSPRKAAAKQQWDRFVCSNQPIITASGIPASVFSAVGRCDNFLCHGNLDEQIGVDTIHVDSLNPAQYSALVILTESYFAAGYEWFTPSALRPTDQDNLRKRFAR